MLILTNTPNVLAWLSITIFPKRGASTPAAADRSHSPDKQIPTFRHILPINHGSITVVVARIGSSIHQRLFTFMSDSLSKPPDTSQEPTVPKAVVSRLSLYLRELQQIQRDVSPTTSSTELGNRLGFTNAQVRKDLAYFGQFGYPGIGYRCDELISAIKGILGTNHAWPIALVGLGNLGRALLGYRGFTQQGFHIVAVFDNDSQKIGQQVDGIPIYALNKLSELVVQQGIRLAVLAVPAPSAQTVAEEIVAAGIEGILNFAPVTLSLPKQIHTVGVDLAIQLEQLSFSVVQGRLLPSEEPSQTEDSGPLPDDSSRE